MNMATTGAAADAHELTRHFGRWQGLRWLPIGGGALLAAALLSADALGRGTMPTVTFVTAVSIVAADQWIDGYYHRVYGQVRDLPSRRWMMTAARYAAVGAVALVIVVDLRWRFPVLLSGWVIAGAMVTFWWLSGRGRRPWPVLAAVPVTVALLPLTSVVAAGRPAMAVLLAATGAAEIVGGVFDHLMLLHRLREIRGGFRG